MLGDDQDRIDRELRAAAAKSLGDGRVHREPELFRALGAEIAFGFLVDVKRSDAHIWLVPAAAHWVADQKTVADMLGVREVPVYGRDDGYSCRHQVLQNVEPAVGW